MTEIVNLTPHNIDILSQSENVIKVLPPCSNPPRVEEHSRQVNSVSVDDKTIPIKVVSYTHKVDLPEEKPETYYVVSRLIAETRPERTDLLVPYDIVHTPDHSIKGCQSFSLINAFQDYPQEGGDTE